MYSPKSVPAPLIVLPIIAILMTFLWPELENLFRLANKTVCGTNMKALSNVLNVYASEHNQMYPTPSKWCDLLVQKSAVKRKSFQCKRPGEKVVCNYAMNKDIEKLGTNAPPDMVLLFETSSGWNQNGGPKMITAENHQGEGSNVLFSDGHVEFVPAKDIPKLKWTPD